MAPPVLEWTDDVDVVIPDGVYHSFGQVPPGATSAPVERRLWNDRAGAGGIDPARNILAVLYAKVTGGAEWLLDGVSLLEQLVFTVQSPSIPGLEAGIRMGTGIRLRLPDLPAGSFHALNCSVTMPAGAPQLVVEFKLAIDEQRFSAVVDPWAVSRPGVYRGVGRGGTETNGVIWRSGPWSTSGTDQLVHPDFAYYHLGIPYQILGESETISNLDGSTPTPLALGAGEKYGWILSRGSGGRQVTKAPKKVGTPVYPTDFPATPAGDELMGWGVRHADVDSTNLDYTPLAGSELRFFWVETSGTSFTVRQGLAINAAGRKVDPTTVGGGTFPGDGTYLVQVAVDGTVGYTTDGSLLSFGATRLFSITISGGVETARVDLRSWADESIKVSVGWIQPTNGSEAVWVHSGSGRLWIRPDHFGAAVDGMTGTSGSITIDTYTRSPGGPEVSLFTSAPGTDRRISFPFNATSTFVRGRPEKLDVFPGDLVIWRIAKTGDASANQLETGMILDAE